MRRATRSIPATAERASATGVDASVPPGTRFTYDVAVAPTTSNLETGDAVTITSVRGTRGDLEPGGGYVVRGTYTLASADSATLALNVTAVRSGAGHSRSDGQDELVVKRGSGSFEPRKRMPYPGKPHLTFYVAGQAARSTLLTRAAGRVALGSGGMRRILRQGGVFVLALGALAPVAGCKKHKAPGDVAPERSAGVPKALEGPLPKHAVKPPHLEPKLLSAGAEPRSRLRYQWKGGEKQRIELSFRWGNGSLKTPLSATVRVGPVHDGAFAIGFTPIRPAGDSPAGRLMLSTTPVGRTKSVRMDALPRSDEKYATKFASMIVPLPLPEQAVGPGARWELQQDVSTGIKETRRFELVKHEGPRVDLKLEVSQQVPKAEAGNTQVPMNGRCRLTVDLRYPITPYSLTQQGPPTSSLPGATVRIRAIPPERAPKNPLSDTDKKDLSDGQRELIKAYKKAQAEHSKSP